MGRFHARRVPASIVLVLMIVVTACGGGAGPAGSATAAPSGWPSAPASAETPQADLLAALSSAGLAADDLAFLAATTFDVTSSGPGSATVVEHLLSSDTATFTVSIAPATGGTPGLVSATSSTTDDRIEVHLQYLVSADGMPDDVRQSLEGVASAGLAVANIAGGPILTAEVSVFGVTVDWAISKGQSTVRDTAIKNIVEGALPGKAGIIMRLIKAGLTADKAALIGTKLGDQLAELDRLLECAKNPTNPLTIKAYQEDPGARDRVIEQIQETRNDIIANTIALELGVVNGFVAGFGPKWLGYAIGPGTAWSKATLEDLIQERIDEIKRAVPKCECVLVTESIIEPMLWRGERRSSFDNEWLIQGEVTAAGYEETWLYRAVIDPRTKQGTYKYEAIGTIAGGTLTKNGEGVATIALQPDGSVLMTVSASNVRGVITAGGTKQSVDLPLPETAFTWKPVGSASCASPG